MGHQALGRRPISGKNAFDSILSGRVIRVYKEPEAPKLKLTSRISFSPLEPLEEHSTYLMMKNPSKSSPGKVYETLFWTKDSGRFHRGDITCNCPGWVFKKKCRHQDDLRAILNRRVKTSGLPQVQVSINARRPEVKGTFTLIETENDPNGANVALAFDESTSHFSILRQSGGDPWVEVEGSTTGEVDSALMRFKTVIEGKWGPQS